MGTSAHTRGAHPSRWVLLSRAGALGGVLLSCYAGTRKEYSCRGNHREIIEWVDSPWALSGFWSKLSSVRGFLLVVWFLGGSLAWADEVPARGVFNAETGLHRYSGCRLVPKAWADGDSFAILFPDGKERTVRLYGADCLETSGDSETNARRLRAQRRYFGIAGFGGSARASNDKAKEIGLLAKARGAELLADEFTVHTAWADGRGSARYKRYYGFVTTGDGRDLAEVLVAEGLARAYGVYRKRPDGSSAEDYREALRDVELRAAIRRTGVWKLTDWEMLPQERREEREEAAELEAARGGGPGARIDPNTASRDELMSLPGIGEAKAMAIIEARAGGRFRKPADLERVPGLGKKTVARLTPFLEFGSSSRP